ncbi:MAG TPA: hypothetical protein VGG57_15805 [Stellaceae bacterium]|jgi:hypothetical protein
MRRHPRNRHLRPETLAARIDHAAEEINPFLGVIAIGLVVLNLVALAFLAPNLSLSRRHPTAAVKTMPGPQLIGPGGAQ